MHTPDLRPGTEPLRENKSREDQQIPTAKGASRGTDRTRKALRDRRVCIRKRLQRLRREARDRLKRPKRKGRDLVKAVPTKTRFPQAKPRRRLWI